jgi:hypothetical protein
MTNCKNCEKELDSRQGKYCSNKCQVEFQSRKLINEFCQGLKVGKLFQIRGLLREFILDHYENKCGHCGITEWNDKPITFEINHIDGRALNNTLDNLEILCPNCHSQTDTFRNKGNRNSDRTNRKPL